MPVPVPVLVLASLRSLTGLDPTRRVLALAVRSTLVILVACCLARVEHVQRNDDLTVIFLMDRSHSVQALQQHQEEYIRAATQDLPPDDRVGVIDFARDAHLEQLPMRGGYFIPPGSSIRMSRLYFTRPRRRLKYHTVVSIRVTWKTCSLPAGISAQATWR